MSKRNSRILFCVIAVMLLSIAAPHHHHDDNAELREHCAVCHTHTSVACSTTPATDATPSHNSKETIQHTTKQTTAATPIDTAFIRGPPS